MKKAGTVPALLLSVFFGGSCSPSLFLHAPLSLSLPTPLCAYAYSRSYTASGSGPTGGTLECLEAAAARDMGVFIISPADKGGMLYKPSAKFAQCCEPDGLSPIAFNK